MSAIVLSGCAGLASSGSTTPPALALMTSSLPNGQVGSAWSAMLVATGGTAPYYWSVASGSSLPAWMTLGANTGQMSGVPTQSGTLSFTIQVRDSSTTPQTASKAFTISIAPAGAPLSITTSSLPNGQATVLYSAPVVATGGTTPYAWSVVSGSLPAGLSLNSSTGVISGTPSAAGSFPLTIKVTDSSSPAQTASKAFTISIAPVGTTPLSITTSFLPGGQVSVLYSASLAATGGTTPYTWSVSSGSLPNSLTLNSATGQISGTPSSAGSFPFTIQVTDSSSPVQTASAMFTVSIISNATTLTIVTTMLNTGQMGVPYAAVPSATGGAAPYAWSSTGTLPPGLSLNASTGVITGTPSQGGSFAVTLHVMDSSSPAQTASQAYAVVINPATPVVAQSSCGILNSANTTYVLQNDVSSTGTCFTIEADNVTLDLNGHTITYGTVSGGAQVFGVYGCQAESQCPGGGTGVGFSNVTVFNGTISMNPSVTAPKSSNVFLVSQTAAATIANVVFNTWGQDTIPLKLRYYNGGTGHQIFNNTFNDNTDGAINRVLFEGVAFKLDNLTGSPGATIYNNTINNALQGFVYGQTPGTVIDGNTAGFTGQYSDDFGITLQGANMEAKNNSLNVFGGRGIALSGGCFTSPCTTGSPNIRGVNQLVHDNTIEVTEAGYNQGYGVTPPGEVTNAASISQGGNTVTWPYPNLATGYGNSCTGPSTTSYTIVINNESHCILSNTANSVTISGTWAQPSGTYTAWIYVFSCGTYAFGTFGIEFRDSASLDTAYNNQVTAHVKNNLNGSSCGADALRVNVVSGGNFSHDNVYQQVNDPGAIGYDPFGSPVKGGALGFEPNPTNTFDTFTSLRDTFIGDNATVWYEDLGFPNTAKFICQSCTLGKGSNPRAGGTPYATFSFYSFRPNPVYNQFFVDTTFINGASKTNTNLTPIGGSVAYGEYFIQWTYTLTVKGAVSNSPISGARVTVTSNEDGTTPVTEVTGTTNSSGVVSLVLTDLHVFNTSSSVVFSNWAPHNVTILATGCTTQTYSVSPTATTSDSKTLGGC